MSTSGTHASRRNVLAGLGTFALGAISLTAMHRSAKAAEQPPLTVWKDPSCGCCGGWIDHMRRNGFQVTVIETADVQPVKTRQQVPAQLASCHTAVVAGYTLEGHVPVAAVQRLLAEKPAARGLAVPGMPIGSPGMEGGRPEVYDVVLFGGPAQKVFGRYLGDRPA